ncbi:MAG: sugar ABC transporter ATP-binding protein, partial [Planctomycetes bacterium]|nr:sugar ABC transporter ATP-binding protein [Planctomycetota bacterium]
LLIMDEPTASLTTRETEHLFRIIRDLTTRGVSILYISHRMEEVYSLMDRITILRDGRKIGTFARDEISPEDIIRHMIGHNLTGNVYAAPKDTSGKSPVLSVRSLRVPGAVNGISFDVFPGEVVCLSGLMGSGRTETLRAIFGMEAQATGEITVAGKKASIRSPGQALPLGIGFVPEDRRLEGFVPMLSIRDNINSANYDWINRHGWFTNSRREAEVAADAIASLSIRPANPAAQVITLSGGNQQKTVLGKWFARDLKLLLVDEPTAGVDVGAKNEIYALIADLLKKDVGVLLASSDLEEVLRLANRILILHKGRIIKEAPGGSVNQEQLLTIASGLDQESMRSLAKTVAAEGR